MTEPKYNIEIKRDTSRGIETDQVSGVRGSDVQAVKDGAKFTSQRGDTVTFRVTEAKR